MHSLIAYYLSYMMLSDQLNTLSGLLVVEGRNVLLFNAFTIGLVDGVIAPSTGGMLQFQYYNWNVTIVV